MTMVTIAHRTCQKCKLGKYDVMFPKWGKHVGKWCKRCMDAEGLKFEAMEPTERRRFLPTMPKPRVKPATDRPSALHARGTE